MNFKRKNTKGQALPITLIAIAITIAFVFSNINRIHMLTEKIRVQKQADAFALKIGTEYARSLNALSGLNQGIDHMITQYQIYAGVAVAATIVAIYTGFAAKAIIREFAKGIYRISKGLYEVGEAFDQDITQIQEQTLVNLCNEIKKENLLQKIHFLKKHYRVSSSLFDDPFSQKSVTILTEIFKGTRHNFVQVYPNVCDDQIQETLNPYVRVSDYSAAQTCQKLTFHNRQELQMFNGSQMDAYTFTTAKGVYQFDPEDDTTAKPMIQTRYMEFPNSSYGLETSVPEYIQLDREANASKEKPRLFRFGFVSGEVEVCTDTKKILTMIRNSFRTFPIPKKIRLKDFHKKSDFMVQYAIPYRSIKPFQKSTDLFSLHGSLIEEKISDVLAQANLDLDELKSIRDTIQNLFQNLETIDVYSQVSIKGSHDLQSMDHTAQLRSISPEMLHKTRGSDQYASK
ncbi:MAG: hypothetical protein KDD46_07155 [Bdellovibrionales bacterium]|nr:hypothetical protein [Bdellovibrionales bacterium]